MNPLGALFGAFLRWSVVIVFSEWLGVTPWIVLPACCVIGYFNGKFWER
jgi:hypothetical protein